MPTYTSREKGQLLHIHRLAMTLIALRTKRTVSRRWNTLEWIRLQQLLLRHHHRITASQARENPA
jgi:hypothetical protein